MIENIILFVAWPILIIGSIYILSEGGSLYKLVSQGLIGRFSKTFVLMTVVEMYSLGIVATVLMFLDKSFISLVIPVFLVWFITSVLSIREIKHAKDEYKKMTENAE